MICRVLGTRDSMLRLMVTAVFLSLVSAAGCSGDRPSNSTGEGSARPGSAANAAGSDASAGRVPETAGISETQDSVPTTSGSTASTGGCEAQGIGPEETFARRLCAAAQDFGFEAELVHSYGAGGVDVFISEAEAANLRRDSEKLRRQIASLTEWAKQNYSGFNAVEVTIVGGDSRIAKGQKIGVGTTKVEIY